MRILVLGGTWFLGKAIVSEAIGRGHEVTTFNRGQSAPDAEGVEAVHGDRTRDYDLVGLAAGRHWDAVIDTSGMVPNIVLKSATVLRDHADRFVYVSTVNVYQGWPTEPLNEESAVRDCPPDTGDEDRGESKTDRQGRLKSGCERAVTASFNERALMLRPGVILGPHEYIGRLPWWLERIAKGGQVLAPGSPDRPIQPIDVRDVATFTVDGLGQELAGAFNVTAPVGHSSYGEMLSECKRVTGSDAELVWVDDDFLLAHEVSMWRELPLWRTYPGTWQVDSDRARAHGLRARPLGETVRDTWEWMSTGGMAVDHQRRSFIGIDSAKETAVLAAWDRLNR